MATKTTCKKITLYLDGPLVEVGKKFVAGNPREKSLSDLLERLLLQHLTPRVRKAKLRIPAHLTAEE